MNKTNVFELNVGELRTRVSVLAHKIEITGQDMYIPIVDQRARPQLIRGWLVRTFPDEYYVGKQPYGAIGGRKADRGVEFDPLMAYREFDYEAEVVDTESETEEYSEEEDCDDESDDESGSEYDDESRDEEPEGESECDDDGEEDEESDEEPEGDKLVTTIE
jgi:hypothetical protein